MNDTLQKIQESLSKGNRVLAEEQERRNKRADDAHDVEILKLLDPTSDMFKEILEDVIQRRRHFSSFRESRESLNASKAGLAEDHGLNSHREVRSERDGE